LPTNVTNDGKNPKTNIIITRDIMKFKFFPNKIQFKSQISI